MKQNIFLISNLLLVTILFSCNNKKLTEVVEVPLPTAQEKIAIGLPEDVKANEGAFQMEKLSYAYDALAPNISAIALEMHYSKHYLTYTNNLNKAIAGTDLENLTIEELLSKLDLNNANIRNNAGGYYNHTLYWQCMGPKAGGEPKDTLADAITKRFGTFANFTSLFKNESEKIFGSGWVWLVVDKAGQLQLTSTQNQDNPLMADALIQGKPILALDVWEHAYYLDYQYKRKNYIDAFFNVINWKKVAENYEAAIKK
ncbi:Fe-Mn family superoxide dismutase [Flavobacterium sp. CG_23.5]|uniref:superoxide dismutase n=1 Tax=unclassified Flavobacterium TaxID=196869 RepID=UPI0018C91E73|nr:MULTISPECIES: superoxide dismutase [unclassified Flavobacterium]MBG6111076.1 Fe-Mn family superoxide dismutase [Flavobacterium sp. CG_9.10]MBP2282524.1 Fe-Mn family superoxide dismutase [Flavobacterium sp. CG_23.5]